MGTRQRGAGELTSTGYLSTWPGRKFLNFAKFRVSALGDDLLNASLFAQLHGPPPAEFPSGEAVRIWAPRKARRLSIVNIGGCRDRQQRSHSAPR